MHKQQGSIKEHIISSHNQTIAREILVNIQDQGNNPSTAKLVPEGIEGQVPYKGSVVAIVFQMAGGLRASMHYCGCASIEEMHQRAEFVEITTAGIRESHVHDVQITKEAPNYRRE